MSHKVDLQLMTVADLAQRCAQETDLYFHRQEFDSSYCLELFRRAIRNNDEHALEVVIAQYRPLVARWVDKWMDRQPDFYSFNEEPQDFIAQAFERFWLSFTPDKLEKSQSLAAVLRYLQMCVNGAIMDARRKASRLRVEQEARDEEQDPPEMAPTPEDLLQADEFWQLIRKKSRDPKEYTVIYASYYLALSPREIFAEYPDQFNNTREIYQHKVNFLERLGRDDDLKRLIQ